MASNETNLENTIGSLDPITKTDWYHYLLLQEQRRTNELLQQLLDIRNKQAGTDPQLLSKVMTVAPADPSDKPAGTPKRKAL